ncbi:MAG TPA: lysophospholipid acyltransferase family protein [Acidisarcina sp.]
MIAYPGARPDPLPLRERLLSNLVQAPLFGLATILFGTLSLLASLFDRDGRAQHAIARTWAALTLRISRCPVAIIGGENLTRYPVALYAANHASYMDTPVIFSSLPTRFRILAKHELWKVPFIGWHLRRSGQIPINAENARASVASLNIGVRALKAGMPLFIFPEGGRSESGDLAPFMNGASYIAVRAGVPIVPLALVGTYELLPIHTRAFHPRPLLLVAGEPIVTDGYTSKNLDELTCRLRSAIAELFYSHSGRPRPELRADEVEADDARGADDARPATASRPVLSRQELPAVHADSECPAKGEMAPGPLRVSRSNYNGRQR